MAEARTGAKIEIYRQDSQKNENHQLQTHFLKHSTYGIVKVITEKSCGEVSLLKQDTIENVSLPIQNSLLHF